MVLNTYCKELLTAVTIKLLFILFVIPGVEAQVKKPVITSTPLSRIGLNQVYLYKIDARDSAGDPLKYSIKEIPHWITYDSTAKTLSGKSSNPGQFPIEIEVTDPYSGTQHNFMLTVYNKNTQNILCLGNSITNGTDKYNSYRRELWKMLHAGGYNFDFIGSWDKNSMGGEVPDPDFDMDHEGHSGWTFADFFHPPSWDSVRGNIHRWLGLYKPDIVLLELGTNDVFQCRPVNDMLKDLQQLIHILRSRNHNVKIFVAQIPPLGKQWAAQKLCGNNRSYDEAIVTLNTEIASFCSSQTKKESPVISVDQYTGVNPALEMYDDIHPNNVGEKKMAERWFRAIDRYLPTLK